jgi:tRNA threonylcarbamoyladenosine biosynthesis protein TsaE
MQAATVVRLVRSPQAMRALGRRLARLVPPGRVIGLCGPLGAGKTVLTQGIAAGLGLRVREVTSPSFALCRIHPGSTPLVHIDLYRLADEAEAHEAGLLEWIDDPRDALVVVEWFERLGREGADLRVGISFVRPSGRRVRITGKPGRVDVAALRRSD